MTGTPGSSGPSCSLRPLSSAGDCGADQGDSPCALGPWPGRQLRKRELEREKARALQLSWKPEQPLQEQPLQERPLQEPSKEPGPTPLAPQAKPAHPEEVAKGPKEEVSGPHARALEPRWPVGNAPRARAEGCRLAAGWLPGLALPRLSCVMRAGDSCCEVPWNQSGVPLWGVHLGTRPLPARPSHTLPTLTLTNAAVCTGRSCQSFLNYEIHV